MTTVAGIRTPSGVWIGGDSASLSGWDHVPRSDPKVGVARTADGVRLVLGFSRSYRWGNLLVEAWDPPAIGSGPAFRWMIRDAMPGLRALMKEAGYTKVDSNREEGGSALIGIAGDLLEVDDDFQVARHDGFAAIGAGRPYAMAALEVSRRLNPDAAPAWHLRLALGVAAKYSASTRPPFRVVHA